MKNNYIERLLTAYEAVIKDSKKHNKKLCNNYINTINYYSILKIREAIKNED